MIAKVIVDVNIKKLNRPFDYVIPKHLEELVQVGARVIVPFNVRKIMGIIIDIYEGSKDDLKEIESCIDLVPTFNEELLQLGMKLATETASNLIHTFKTMIPSAMKAKYRKYVLDENKKVYLDTLSLSQQKKYAKKIKNGLEVIYEVTEKGRIKTEKYLYIVENVEVNTLKQQQVLDFLYDGKVLKKTVLEYCSASSVNTLMKKGIIAEEEVEVYRDLQFISEDKKVVLTDLQQDAVGLLSNGVNLLHGVTGSGKTEVYIEWIEQTDKEVILLVPEIALTYQMIKRFKGRFQDDVAILHSGLSEGEKYDEWRKIIRKEVRIVIGARSAIFAPFENLGLIIIDEEHETTYKQDDSPRYHAREVAKMRAEYHGCPLVLGSATPSLESYARAKRGIYNLIELGERYSQKLPYVHTINMKDEPHSISAFLLEKILNRVKNKEQIILLVNRRGYSNFVMCKDCGEVIQCDSCDVSMTHHKYKNKLECHYCGATKAVPDVCPSCGSKRVEFLGIGTESVEEELNNALPGIRILRMDQDTTRTKNAHAKILEAFENGEADVLLGTQMIAKGLDFDNVTLVGVISCEQMLNLPDFRSSERTYQLLTQVAGRSGRMYPGEVVFQTYNEEHYAISMVQKPFEEFYNKEMEFRRLAGYVPYFYVENIMLSSDDYRLLHSEASKIAQHVTKRLSKQARIMGPVIPSISKVRNYHRVQIIIKYKKEDKLILTYQEIEQLIHDKVDMKIDRYPNYLG